jgi:defect-in-organelle-trafficking protein DotB
MFPYEVQGAAATKLLGALRMMVVQKLLRTTDGKRAAIREWIVFDREVRDLLWGTPINDWPKAIQVLVDRRGSSLAVAARALYEAGRIDHDTFVDAAELPVGAA